MPLYDVAMLVVLGGAMLFGFWKGLAWQLASLAAVVVSYFVSVNFRDPVSKFIQADEPWNRIGAMLMLFLGTSLLIWTIYARVSKSLTRMELKGFDRQAGAILGAFKGSLLCMVITMFAVSLLGKPIHDSIHLSTTGRYVIRGIGLVSSIIPPEFAKFVDPHVDNFESNIGHSVDKPLDQYPQRNTYPAGGQYSQDPSQLPPSQSPYRGQFQWDQAPATQAGFGQPAENYTGQQNNFQGGQASYNQNSFGTGNGIQFGTGQGTQANGQSEWPRLDVSVDSKQLLDAVIDRGKEAARRALENGQR